MSKHVPRILPKSRVEEFLKGLGVPVASPAPVGGSDVEFRLDGGYAGAGDGYLNSAISPVKFAFPQTQLLWRYRLSPTTAVTPPAEPYELAIFGIRSCDVTAFRYLQKFFSRAPADSAFLEAAARILLIGVSCLEPGPHCFCVCGDAGPILDDGYDVQLTDLGEAYLFEVGSEKGVRAAAKGERLLEPAPEAAVRRKAELKEATLQKFEITCHFATGIRKITSRKVAEELWRRMSARCIECGGCSFVCPMCTCFDVADFQESAESGWRERSWDCCQFAGYSREASGYNPRADKGSRFKRRFQHKLSYFYLLADGVHGCVGCGRCVQTCFGEVDMPAVVNAIRAEAIPAREG